MRRPVRGRRGDVLAGRGHMAPEVRPGTHRERTDTEWGRGRRQRALHGHRHVRQGVRPDEQLGSERDAGNHGGLEPCVIIFPFWFC